MTRYTSEYKSKSYYPGAEFACNNGDTVVILGKPVPSRKDFYVIQFLDTGYTVEAATQGIKNGRMQDPYKPTLCGVGKIGVPSVPSIVDRKHTKEYQLWHNMINRCYNEKANRNEAYYGKVTVSDEWLCYEYFLQDLPNIPGYHIWKNNEDTRAIHMDKDGLVPGNTVYSKDTVQFITMEENMGLKVND